MRRLAFALLLIPAVALGADAVVTRVIDGDTIEAGGRDVRLQGIDAPESDQPHGREARAALAGLIQNRRVRLDVRGEDRYDRLIAVIHSEGRNANRWMVRRAHACEDAHYLYVPTLARLAWPLTIPACSTCVQDAIVKLCDA